MDVVSGEARMSRELISREVRLDENGEPWSQRRDPEWAARVREVYRNLYASGEEGRQLVAIHQEIIAMLDAMIDAKTTEHTL